MKDKKGVLKTKGNAEEVLKCAGLWEGIVTDKEAEDMKKLIIKHRKSRKRLKFILQIS